MTNRPTLRELCGIETCQLIGVPHEKALELIISTLKDEKRSLAIKLHIAGKDSNVGYSKICELNTKLVYVEKAIKSRTQDYEEMMSKSPEYKATKPNGQSKKHSHYEITANQVAGIIIGWCLVYFVFPIMGIEPTATQATISSALFFIGSYTRAYAIRRFFNKWVY